MIGMKIIEEAAKAACVGLINKEYFAAKIKFIEGAEWYGKQVEDIVSNSCVSGSFSALDVKEFHRWVKSQKSTETIDELFERWQKYCR